MTFLFDVYSVLECNKCLEVRQKAQALQMEALNGRDKGHVVVMRSGRDILPEVSDCLVHTLR